MTVTEGESFIGGTHSWVNRALTEVTALKLYPHIASGQELALTNPHPHSMNSFDHIIPYLAQAVTQG